MPEENELQTLTDLINRAQTVQVTGPGGKPMVIVPSACHVVDVEKYAAVPSRRTGNPQFTRAGSFCGYVNDQKGVQSRLYVASALMLVAVLDHHDFKGGGPGWGQHRATLNLTQSPEWKTWLGKNQCAMSQRDFAQFIEDNSEDIMVPSGAELLELVRTLKTSVNLECLGEIDDVNDVKATGFVVHTKTKAGVKGELELPAEFALGVSPYEGGEVHKVRVRLRLEPAPPKLNLRYELVKVQQIENEALERIVAGVASDTEMDAWYGVP